MSHYGERRTGHLAAGRPRLTAVAGGAAEPSPAPAERADLAEALRGFKLQARSKKTREAYESDWRHFAAWCGEEGLAALPAEPATVDVYLAAHAAALRPSTLERRLVSISRVHKAAGYPDSPTTSAAVRETMRGIWHAAAEEDRAAPRQAAALLTEDVRRIAAALPEDTLMGARDRALLLLAFAGALRASEVGGIHVSDLRETSQGYLVTIRRSKTDQKGMGQVIALPYGKSEGTCPVKAIKAWLRASGIKRGALIRGLDRHGNVAAGGISRHGVVHVVRRLAALIDLDAERYSGHSLRAGLATSAAIANVPYSKIKAQGRWSGDRMLSRYIRDGELFRGNAAEGAGL
jgi:site-specific recombinase XerD